jgi:hypothetical protein
LQDNIDVEKAFVAAAEQVKKSTPAAGVTYSDTVDLNAQKGKCCA